MKPARCLSALAALMLLAPATVVAQTKTAPAPAPAAAAKGDGMVLAKVGHVPKPGTKLTKSKSMEVANAVMTVEAGGQKMDGTMSMSETETEAVEYVSPVKVKSKVTASKKGQKVVMNGQTMPAQDSASPLLDKAVVITKADDVWSAALEEGEPTEEQAAQLSKDSATVVSKDDKVYGTVPRKVGETWAVDPKDTFFSEADQKNPASGELKLTFKAIEEYAGKKCARIEGTLDMKGKTDEAQGGQDLTLKGSVVILRSLEDMVDLKVDFDGKMTMGGTIPGGSMSMSGDMKIKEDNKIN